MRIGEDHRPLCDVLTDYGFESIDGSDVESTASGYIVHTRDGQPIRIVRKGHLRRALRSPFSKDQDKQGLNALPYSSTPIKFEDSGLFGSNDDLSSIWWEFFEIRIKFEYFSSRSGIHKHPNFSHPQPRHRSRLLSDQSDAELFNDGASIASDCSASLRIVWDGEGPCWDDEFDEENCRNWRFNDMNEFRYTR